MTDLSEMIHAMADERSNAADRASGDTSGKQDSGVLELRPAVRQAPPQAPEVERTRKTLRLLG